MTRGKQISTGLQSITGNNVVLEEKKREKSSLLDLDTGLAKYQLHSTLDTLMLVLEGRPLCW